MSWKGFKKAVNRLPHTLSQNMGMVDQSLLTKDDEYDFYQQQFTDLLSLTQKLSDASVKYKESVAKMLQHQVSFAKTMMEVYDEIEAHRFSSSSSLPESSSGRWGLKKRDEHQKVITDKSLMDRVEKLADASEALQSSINPKLDVVIDRTVVQPCVDYANLHKMVQKVMTKRDHKKIDLDRNLVDLKKIKDKIANDGKSSDEKRIIKAEQSLENAQRDYDNINVLLKEQLPVYINYRISFVDPILINLLIFHSQLFGQMHQILNEEKQLNSLVDMNLDAVAGYERHRAYVESLIDSVSIAKGLITAKSTSSTNLKSDNSEPEFDDAETSSLPAYSPTSPASGSNSSFRPPSYQNAGAAAVVSTNPFASQPQQRSSSFSNPSKPPRWNPQSGMVTSGPPQTNPFTGSQQNQTNQVVNQFQNMSVKAPPPKPTKPATLSNSPTILPVSQIPTPRPAIPSIQKAVALYEFQAQQPGDLSFNVDDVIEVLEKTPNVNDWWKGKFRGQIGVFPGNYVKLI